MSFIHLEDMTETAEIVLFPKTFALVEKWLNDHHLFVVNGVIDPTSSKQLKIKANTLIPLECILEEWPQINKVLCVLPNTITETSLEQLKAEFPAGNVPLEFMLEEHATTLRIRTTKRIAVSNDLLETAEKQYDIKMICHL